MNHRYIARIKVEATTPLFVGSGGASLITDALAVRDHNGLPMIPGTSLSGVLRHTFFFKLENKNQKEYTEEDWNNYFDYGNLWGCQIENKQQEKEFKKWYEIKKGQDAKVPDGLGSRLIISSAYLVLNDGKIAEGIDTEISPEILSKFQKLPTRQHVRITHKGVAADKGLFDNEVVYAGARFIFEIELKGTKTDEDSWKQIIKEIKSPSFRIGQGTRDGYGNLKVIGLYEKTYNLVDENDFEAYLSFNPSLNSIKIERLEEGENNNTADYTLNLTPDDFFIFSEGFGDADVDNKPVTEEVIEYKNNKIDFVEKTLIPASSIKGTIAHRTAFHYNKLNKFYADTINENLKNYVEENNQAVKTLFGEKAQVINGNLLGERGIVILDDLYYADIDNSKIFNHVAIDRFTGGGIDGALFSEKVSYKKDKKITLTINLSKTLEDTDIIKALEEALKDICRGLLPLGGMTTKGFGMFTGKLLRKGAEIFNYNNQKAEA